MGGRFIGRRYRSGAAQDVRLHIPIGQITHRFPQRAAVAGEPCFQQGVAGCWRADGRLYERNWRHVQHARLTTRERALLAALMQVFGAGFPGVW